MTNQETTNKVDILIGSPNQDFFEIIQVVLQGFYPYQFRWLQTAESILSNDYDFNPVLALIDGRYGTAQANEWTQSTKMTFPNAKIIVLHNGRDLLDFAQVKKNGADEIMHINYDREFIADMVLTMAPIDLEGDIPVAALLSVDTRDLLEDTELNFDLFIHLPTNQKTIKYKREGSSVEKKVLDRFENANQNMYVKKTQTKQFFEYARTMASMKNMDSPVSATEKLNKSKKFIYEIMSQFMNGSSSDYQEGRIILEKCKEIITEFEFTQAMDPKNILKEVSRFSGHPRSIYNDAINLAAIAALFAQAIEWPLAKCEDAALCGLLHNIGLALLPTSTAGKSYEELTLEDQQEFRMYPERSVIMVKGKKVPLNPEVSEGILMHRERADGTGFPKSLKSEKINEMGKLLGLSYLYLEATSLEKGTRAYTPEAAIKNFKDEALKGNELFDIILTTKLAKKLI
ncbi:MAG: HD-GYP domain-containing protein [Bdellovibrionia bacterium]